MACARSVVGRARSRNQRPATSGVRRAKCCTESRGRAERTRPAYAGPVCTTSDPGEGTKARGCRCPPLRTRRDPERGREGLVVRGPDSSGQLAEEVGATSGQRLEDRLVLVGLSSRRGRGASGVRCRPCAARPQPSEPGSPPATGPEHLACRASPSSIEAGSRRRGRAARATPARTRYGAPGELLDHGATPVDTWRRPPTFRQAGRNRANAAARPADLVAQPGQRASSQGAQHLGANTTPSWFRRAGTRPPARDPGQRAGPASGGTPRRPDQPLGHLSGGERTVGR